MPVLTFIIEYFTVQFLITFKIIILLKNNSGRSYSKLNLKKMRFAVMSSFAGANDQVYMAILSKQTTNVKK